MPAPDLVPSLTTLDPQEAIRMELGSVLVSSETPGRTLGVFSDIPSAGLHDIDPTYSIGLHPADVIYVLEFQLSTTAAGIAASDPVHVLLSPDGATPAERLHHATLHLERYLGTPVPEPATGTLLALPLIATALFRRRPG